jgi:hypothetical protein
VGGGGGATLPAEVEKNLRRWSRNVLESHHVPDEAIALIVEDLVYVVSCAHAGREMKFIGKGPGRRVAVPASLYLSRDCHRLLSEHGGNWLLRSSAKEKEEDRIGLVTEIEAVCLTALRQASDPQAEGVQARPARITAAGRILGEVCVTRHPDMILWGHVVPYVDAAASPKGKPSEPRKKRRP